MKLTLCLPVALLAILTGCSTPGAKVIDAGGPQVITSLNKIDIQDFSNAADTMVHSLIDSVIDAGKLESPPNTQAILAISRIVNSTLDPHLDTDFLTKRIRVALNKTGRVATTTTMGVGGKAEDEMAKDLQALQAFTEEKQERFPDYTLSGKIIQLNARAGNVRQATYEFQLSLSRRGVAVWEDTKTIVKQGTRNSVGL